MSRPRAATADDYPWFAKLFPELGTGDPVPSFAQWRDQIAPQTVFLEDERGDALAYAFTRMHGDLAVVTNVVVRADARGRGLGRALMNAIQGRLRASGCTRWALNVKPDNEPAVRLYRSFGFEKHHDSWSMRFPYEAIDRLPLPAEPARAEPIQPFEDAAVETQLDLLPGDLKGRRARGYVLLGIRRLSRASGDSPECPEAEWRGVAAFDPTFPGAMPFRTCHRGLARPLLEAMRTYARPEHDHALVTVEIDRDLLGILLGAGAHMRFEMMHMQGRIPEGGDRPSFG